MVTVSFNSADAIRIMDAFLAQDNIEAFPLMTKYQDIRILIKIYKATSGESKGWAKDILDAYFDESKMKYKSFMPSFLRPKVKK